VGEAKAVSAARPLALALGHDIESIVEGANGRDVEGVIRAEGASGSPPGSGRWRR